jgi:antitoxin ParD1/3/4
MTVTLSPQLEELIQSKVASGRYGDANEVVREALELLDEHEHNERLRAALAIGFEQLERGEETPYTPESRAEAMQQVRKMAAEGQKPKADVRP